MLDLLGVLQTPMFDLFLQDLVPGSFKIELAIEQFFDSVHSYQDPQPGMNSFLAHCWVWRGRLTLAATAFTMVLGGLWFLFS